MFGLGNPGDNLAKKIIDDNNYSEWEKALLIQGLQETENSKNVTVQSLRSQVCNKCPNNPKNGGSGICNCTLGLPEITY